MNSVRLLENADLHFIVASTINKIGLRAVICLGPYLFVVGGLINKDKSKNKARCSGQLIRRHNKFRFIDKLNSRLF